MRNFYGLFIYEQTLSKLTGRVAEGWDRVSNHEMKNDFTIQVPKSTYLPGFESPDFSDLVTSI